MRLVTISAVSAERFFMKVILFMAAYTGGIRIPEFFTRGVAIFACEGRVLAFQRKTRPAVAKRIYLHGNYVAVAPQMIGVAVLTWLNTGERRLAVKTLLAVAVRSDLVVTIEAEIGHGRLVERGVAFFALGFEFRMALNHFTRHEQSLLDRRLLRPSGAAYQQPQEDCPGKIFHE